MLFVKLDRMGKRKLKSPPRAGTVPAKPAQPALALSGRGTTGPLELSPSAPRLDWRAAVLLVALPLLAYAPVYEAGFIWDDDQYVTDNHTLRDWSGLVNIWTDRHANPQYYPLVHTTFWLEYHLWKLRPLGYHLVNVALHAANAFLLWLLLRKLAVPGAWWAGALFAVHPVEVESVAWVTERKNVLSAFCYLGAFLTWLKFWPLDKGKRPIARQPAGRHGSWSWYAATLVLFAAALCSKTVACSLPAALLLVRWWKCGQLTRRDWLVTAPLFALGLVLALNTAALEKEHVGAVGPDWDFSFLDRMLIAGRALWFYAGKLVWPVGLTFIYPRWTIDAGVWWQYLFPLAAVAVIGALWALRSRLGRGPLVAVLFFAGTLFPALGFFNVYPMRFSFVADHFQYLASAGLLALAGAIGSLAGGSSPARMSGILLVCAAAFLTWRQGLIYHDELALWDDTLARNPACWMAYHNRGTIYFKLHDYKKALPDFCKAIEIKPDHVAAHTSRGAIYMERGDLELAAQDFQQAVQLPGDQWLSHLGLGTFLKKQGRLDAALTEMNLAEQLTRHEPRAPRAKIYKERGAVLHDMGRYAEAIADFTRAIELDPAEPGVSVNRAASYEKQAQSQQGALRASSLQAALSDCQQALQRNANDEAAYLCRGTVRLALREPALALDDFNRCLELKPDNPRAIDNRGLAYHHLGKLDEALRDYSRGIELRPDSPDAYANRAVLFAARNQPAAALADLDKALALRPNPWVYFNRAEIHFVMQSYAAAWDDIAAGEKAGGQPSPDLVSKLAKAAPRPRQY
jgi:protein O-mannosyl-transferase